MTSFEALSAWLTAHNLFLEIRSTKQAYYAFLKDARRTSVAAGTAATLEGAISNAVNMWDASCPVQPTVDPVSR